MDISVAQLIFQNVSGTRFVGMDTETDVSRLKRDEAVQPGKVTKRTTGAVVMVFAQDERSAYSNQVKRRMEAEGIDPNTWEAGELPYGEWMGSSVFISHTPKNTGKLTHYLRTHFVKSGTSEYFLDGVAIAKNDIVDTSAPKKEGTQGGQDVKVIPRNFKLDSIRKIRIDGNELTV